MRPKRAKIPPQDEIDRMSLGELIEILDPLPWDLGRLNELSRKQLLDIYQETAHRLGQRERRGVGPRLRDRLRFALRPIRAEVLGRAGGNQFPLWSELCSFERAARAVGQQERHHVGLPRTHPDKRALNKAKARIRMWLPQASRTSLELPAALPPATAVEVAEPMYQ